MLDLDVRNLLKFTSVAFPSSRQSQQRWRVGNGARTSIWGDAWLSSEGSGRIPTRRSVSSGLRTRWGILLIGRIGHEIENSYTKLYGKLVYNRYLKSPSAHNIQWMVSICSLHFKEKLFLRPCYYQIMEAKDGISSSGPTHGSSDIVWKSIWNLQLPPKVRTFVWWACNDIIPVKAASALMRCKLGIDLFCSFYSNHIENMTTSFFSVPPSRIFEKHNLSNYL